MKIPPNIDFEAKTSCLPEAVWLLAADGTLSHLNKRWFAFSGFREQPRYPVSFWKKILHPEDFPKVESTLRQSLKFGTKFQIECRIKTLAVRQYRWFLIRMYPFFQNNGKLQEWLGCACDIHYIREREERCRLEQDGLIRLQERFSLAIRSSKVGIWDWNPVTGEAYVSSEWKAMLGYSDKEFEPGWEKWLSIVHPDDRARLLKNYKKRVALKGKVMKSRVPPSYFYEIEYRLLHRDGTYRWILTRAHIFFDRKGKQTIWSGSDIDITDRKITEKELEDYRRHLEERVKQRTHDLTVLNEQLHQENIQRTKMEKQLKDKNLAMREILNQIEIEKETIKKQIVLNIHKIILPRVQKLKKDCSEVQKKDFQILEKNIQEIGASFGGPLAGKIYRLTPRQIEICNLIKSGFSTKDIAKFMSCSPLTVETHRNRIRKKLELSSDVNLATYLQKS